MNGSSTQQIEHMIHIIFTVYRGYVANGKDPTSCRIIISAFTVALQKWWQRKMTVETWNKWEQTKIKNAEGLEDSNLIGCMTAEIIKYWGGITLNIKSKNTQFLLNMKILLDFEKFHRDWVIRIKYVENGDSEFWKKNTFLHC